MNFIILYATIISIRYSLFITLGGLKNMIRNNLALLLTERNIKAIKVSNETGIAQSTLSKIANNSTEKIDYSTINTLCNHLKITPCEFFEYSPIDVNFFFEVGNSLLSKKEIYEGHPELSEISAFINILKYGTKIGSIEYKGDMLEYTSDEKGLNIVTIDIKPCYIDEESEMMNILKNLSTTLQTKIKDDFFNFILKECDYISPLSSFNIELY